MLRLARNDKSGLYLAVSMTVVGIVGAIALLGAPLPRAWSDSGSLLMRALFNFAHFPLFVFLAFIICRALRCRTLKQYGLALLVVLAVSIGTELAQTFTGTRDASWSDGLTDMLGAFAGSGLWALVSMGSITITPRSAGLSLLIAACAAAAFLPVTTPIRILAAQQRAFPELYRGDFPGTEWLVESLGDLDEVRLQPQDGSLYITLLKGSAPGVVLWHFAGDWRGFELLKLDVENLEHERLLLGVLVRDRESTAEHEDRFNAERELAGRERALLQFKLSDIENGPSRRPMRMDQVSLIAVHRLLPGSSRFAVHSVRLE
jgi:VanZ family protein